MTVNQKGDLTAEDRQRLLDLIDEHRERVAEFRAEILAIASRSSLRAVSAVTTLSTNTLSRWKRDT